MKGENKSTKRKQGLLYNVYTNDDISMFAKDLSPKTLKWVGHKLKIV